MSAVWIATTVGWITITLIANISAIINLRNCRRFFHPGCYYIQLFIFIYNVMFVFPVLLPHASIDTSLTDASSSLGSFLCQLFATLFQFVQHWSSLSLTIIATERIIKFKPLSHRRIFIRPLTHFLLIFGGCFLSGVFALFPVIGWGSYSFVEEQRTCATTVKGFEKHVKYFYFLCFAWILFPGVVLSILCMQNALWREKEFESSVHTISTDSGMANSNLRGIHCMNTSRRYVDSCDGQPAARGTRNGRSAPATSSGTNSLHKQGSKGLQKITSTRLETSEVPSSSFQSHSINSSAPSRHKRTTQRPLVTGLGMREQWNIERARLTRQAEETSVNFNLRIQNKLDRVRVINRHEVNFTAGVIVINGIHICSYIPQLAILFCLTYRFAEPSQLLVFLEISHLLSLLHFIVTPFVMITSSPQLMQRFRNRFYRRTSPELVAMDTESDGNRWIADRCIDPYHAGLLHQLEQTV